MAKTTTVIADVQPAKEHVSLQDILNTIHDEIVALRNTLGNVLVGSATWDPGSLVDAAGETSADITVTGAALGDFVLCSFDKNLVGIVLTGYVKAADTVNLRLQNESAATVDLASGTARVLVIPKAAVALAAKVLSKT